MATEPWDQNRWLRATSDEEVYEAMKAACWQYRERSARHTLEAIFLGTTGQRELSSKARWFAMALRDYAAAEERPAPPVG